MLLDRLACLAPDTTVQDFKVAPAETGDRPAQFTTYGTMWAGLETMEPAWNALTHTFSVNAHHEGRALHRYPGPRPPRNVLMTHPVDLLVVEQGHMTRRPDLGQNVCSGWQALVEFADRPPRVVLETWPGRAGLWANGPTSKASAAHWERLGYATRCKLVVSDQCGGPVGQRRLLVVRLLRHHSASWEWAELDPPGTVRPMGNGLTPPGLVPPHQWRPRPPPYVRRVFDPQTEVLPWGDHGSAETWIQDQGRFRKVTPCEKGGLLGATLAPDADLRASLHQCLGHTTSRYHWEYFSQCLHSHNGPVKAAPPTLVTIPGTAMRNMIQEGHLSHPAPAPPSPPCSWRPPDLTPGRPWHTARLNTLFAAAKQYPGREIELINHGLDCLRRHRWNYDANGSAPTHLQILWWEFPREHWDDLREGSSMNFLLPPPAIIHPNGEMTPDQQEVAARFVDELIELGVIGPPPPGVQVTATTPLFSVPKPGQPGQWRIIADMLKGGQNSVASNDPVYLNRPLHILEQLYAGGWTAVVDASKFFHQFLTREDERRYLGLIHPVTGDILVWNALPMGGANSPACAGRFGLAFLRLLREHYFVTGQPRPNCWWTDMTEAGYDPKLGYGYVLVGRDGIPTIRVWVHVDDFAIHGLTRAATEAALRTFLDAAVILGLLCHPAKLKPPSQTAVYTGFILDTRGMPTLRVPTPKREKALAMVDHMLSQPVHKRQSKLALAVLAGTLESLAEATPSRIGHTYLRRLYDAIHEEGSPGGAQRYHSEVTLPLPVREDFQWWRTILATDMARVSRPVRAGTLIPSYGDGSGTGTGGTVELPGQGLVAWMGRWAPYVFVQTSNWKELKTLLLTLQRLTDHHREAVRGTTLFYFTDNSATYYICAAGSSRSPGLQCLVEQIRGHELLLECRLQVIHIPGAAMILQGTDGLSRGIWLSSLRPHVDQQALTASIFRPATYQAQLVEEYASLLGWAPSSVTPSPWDDPLTGGELLHRLSVHHPPPELARQTLIFFLEAWVESPMDTGALFFIPRVVPAFWHGLSRHILELDLIPASQLTPAPLLPIPLLVLTVLPHTRFLRRPRPGGMDPDGVSWADRCHHRAAADTLRQLLPTRLEPAY